ncbi:MAG: AMP-binding protein [Proteobacteria bacterium]|nr:AMP-binding protein [Pseudomonadota bacterium]
MDFENMTLPKLLGERCREYGDRKVAMRRKHLGVWETYTWQDYYDHVKWISLGMISLGLEWGDKVSVIGENDPEWYWAELATQSAGSAVVGIYNDCTAEEVKYFIEHSESSFVFAHDQEQVDKVLAIKDQLPLLKRVFYWDEKGLWFYEHEALMSLQSLMEAGRAYEKAHPGLFEEHIERGKGADIGLILYTSGTTGLPKGAMISHCSYLVAIRDAREIDPLTPEDRYVSIIMPAWAAEQMLGVIGQLWTGVEVNFPEEPETVRADLREIGPSYIMYAPRLWELLCSEIQALMNEARGPKRWSYLFAMPIGMKVEGMKSRRQPVPLKWRMLRKLADWVFFRQLRDMIGFTNVKFAYTAGAPISPDIIHFFRAVGINLKQAFGSTETGAMLTCHQDEDVRPETCGTPIKWAQVKISEEGEILCKGPALFSGYYNNPEATAKCFDEAGWYHYGDGGHIDENGHLIVFGRLSDFRTLASGHRYAPENIEIRLRFSPYLKDCLVLGDQVRDFVTVIVIFDMENVGFWMEKRSIGYTTYADLSQKPETYDLVREELDRVNQVLPGESKMKRFVVLNKEFDPDEAELTRSRKIRRDFVEKKYKDLIDAMYSDRDSYPVETTIVYQDGRKAKMKTDVRIAPCA